MTKSNADQVWEALQGLDNPSIALTPYRTPPQPGGGGGGFLGGAARAVGGAFEPLLLPQDLLFGLLAGARDESKSPVDYWRQVEWLKYAPWGATPERVATGSDILGLYGVENENARQWGGLALDLLADPLLVGSWMSGIGRAAKLTTAGTWGDDLINLGRRIDDSMGLLPVTRDGVTRSLAHSTLPREVVKSIEERSFRIGQAIFNSEIPVLSATIRGLTPRSTALKMRFGTDTGTFLRRAETGATQLGGEVREAVVDSYKQINDLLGNDAGDWWGNLFTALGLRTNIPSKARRFQTGTQEAIFKQAGIIDDNHSALVFGITPWEDISNPAAREFSRAVKPLEEQVTGMQRLSAVEDVTNAVKIVRKAAARNGDNVEEAERAFREVIRIGAESDAMVGFHLSMFQPVQRKFMEATANQLGYVAVDLWNDIIARGMQGKDIDSITEIAVRGGRARLPTTAPYDFPAGNIGISRTRGVEEEIISIEDALGTRTLGEFLENDEFFGRLNFNTYARALGQGHMRRAYGVMMDPQGFENYFQSIERGKLFGSNILDEANVGDALRQQGFTDSARLIEEFMEGITAPMQRGTRGTGRAARRVSRLAGAGERASEVGAVTSASRLAQHLIENGVEPAEAQRALDALVGTVQSSPAYEKFIKKARESISKYHRIASEPRSGLSGQAFLSERKSLEEEILEIFGEMTNPLTSLEQSSNYAARTLPTQEWLRNLYNMARENGLVSDEWVDGLKPLRIDDAPALGGFRNKFVSPYIEKEIQRALKQSQFRTPQWLERISQFIRGGLLSGPNILTANMGGGIYTGSLLGINPIEMTVETLGALRDMARAARDPDFVFEDYRLLREVMSLNLSRMSDAAFVERGAKRLQRMARGDDPEGFRQVLEATADLLRTAIDNPGELLVGARGPRTVRQVGAAFGLQGFATSESVMKIGAYRAALKQGFNVSEAIELARLSTFDYSELPDILRTLRDTGLLLFPGFSYFIMGRTLTGALRRPGAMAVANRMPEAIMNAQGISEDERAAIYASMPEWLRDDIGVPIRTRTGGQGENIYSIVPFNQFLPTNVIHTDPRKTLGPFADSVSQLGIYQPFFELAYAALTGSGEAPFSARYGQQVFEQGRNPVETMGQMMGFLYSNLAPSTLRKAGSFSAGQGFTGVIPSLVDTLVEVPAPLAELGYDMKTMQQGRVMRDLVDNVIASTFRSPQPLAVGGRFPTAARTYNQALFEHREQIGAIQQDLMTARLNGDTQRAERLMDEVRRLNNEFREKWIPLLNTVRNAQQ